MNESIDFDHWDECKDESTNESIDFAEEESNTVDDPSNRGELIARMHFLMNKLTSTAKSNAPRHDCSGENSVNELQSANNKLMYQMQALKVRHSEVTKRRAKLHDELHDLKGKYRCYCRVKPPRDVQHHNEHYEYAPRTLAFVDVYGEGRSFTMNGVFSPTATQQDIFNEMAPIARSVMDGKRVTILAYGQTSSGKTHTMEGSPQQPGLVPNLLDELFRIKEERENSWKVKYQIKVSATEIYNDKEVNLLGSDAGMVSCKDRNHVASVLERCKRNRSVRSNKANERSSRSHLIVSIHVICGENEGRLVMVDLAGSESMDCSYDETETKHINKSLAALGNVMRALSDGSVHVPYRDSALTMALKDSIGVGCRAVMIFNISPDATCGRETLRTLQFSSRVSKIELNVR
jgi:kinesin family protein C2/C3